MSEREKLNYQFLCEIEKSESVKPVIGDIEGIEISIDSFRLITGPGREDENSRPINKVSGRFFLDTYSQIKKALKDSQLADYSPETRFYCWRDENVVRIAPEGYKWNK